MGASSEVGGRRVVTTSVSKRKLRVLTVDVGGTHVKTLATGEHEERKVDSGPTMTPQKMVRDVKRVAQGWKYDVISIGYPGPITHGRILRDPYNLGHGWVGFHFRKAFGLPIKLMNDAAMQALGSYRGGRMLFLGLGTGLGSAMIVDGIVEPMEIAHLPYKKGRTYEDYIGLRGLQRHGKKKWRRYVADIVENLKLAMEPDYVVIGGGNARKLKKLPAGAELGDNRNAFRGGFRMWEGAHAKTLTRHGAVGD